MLRGARAWQGPPNPSSKAKKKQGETGRESERAQVFLSILSLWEVRAQTSGYCLRLKPLFASFVLFRT